MSVHIIPTSLAAMLLYTYPVIVSLLTYALRDETFTRRKVAALVIAVAGPG
jgi:drug/metabolite transporter (DMT)-like permease